MEIIREGSWICRNCQTKNRGSVEICNSCGADRGDSEFIYEEDGREITDEKEKAEAHAGPDWICAFCSSANASKEQKCLHCGGARTEGKYREVKEVFANDSGNVKSSSMASPSSFSSTSASRGQGFHIPSFLKFGCFGVILLFAVLVGFECMSFKDFMEVTTCEWRRTVVVEQYQTIKHHDWVDLVPKNGRITSRESKIRSYKQVLTGYRDAEESYTVKEQVGTKRVKSGVKDLGNGRFSETYRDEPVYKSVSKTRSVRKPVYRNDPIHDTWANFDLDEWIEMEKKTANGTVEDAFWPQTDCASHPQDIVGERREGAKSEYYMVKMKSQKNQKDYEVKEIDGKVLDSEWFKKLRPGTRWDVDVSGLGNIKAIRLPGEEAGKK